MKGNNNMTTKEALDSIHESAQVLGQMLANKELWQEDELAIQTVAGLLEDLVTGTLDAGRFVEHNRI